MEKVCACFFSNKYNSQFSNGMEFSYFVNLSVQRDDSSDTFILCRTLSTFSKMTHTCEL